MATDMTGLVQVWNPTTRAGVRQIPPPYPRRGVTHLLKTYLFTSTARSLANVLFHAC